MDPSGLACDASPRGFRVVSVLEVLTILPIWASRLKHPATSGFAARLVTRCSTAWCLTRAATRRVPGRALTRFVDIKTWFTARGNGKGRPWALDRTENSELLFVTETACQLNVTSPLVESPFACFQKRIVNATVNFRAGQEFSALIADLYR
jgi:hypothetical protein